MPTTTKRTTRKVAYVVAALAVLVAACGDDDATSATEVSTGAPADGDAVTIGMVDYAFEGVPRSIAAGTPITGTNGSAKEAHELVAFRLADDETRSLAELQALPPEELGALTPGAPVLAMVARPGADTEVVLGDGALHDVGRYLLLCFIPTGADPDQVMSAISAAAADPNAAPPQIDGGPPHMAAGMMAEIVVTP